MKQSSEYALNFLPNQINLKIEILPTQIYNRIKKVLQDVWHQTTYAFDLLLQQILKISFFYFSLLI